MEKRMKHEISAWDAWILATRPKTLTAPLIPVAVGTILAKSTGISLNTDTLLFTLLCGILITIGTNFINDALDFKRGADTNERLGPQRVTQSGLLSMRHVYTGGLLAYLLAAIFALPLILEGGWPILVILLFSIISGYLYTGGPYPLAYLGLGDFFVIIFYGFIGTITTYYLQTGYIDAKPALAGLQIGLLATLIIAINNLRDYEGDAKANKKTLPVRFGKTFGRIEITLLTLVPFLLSPLWLRYSHILAAIFPLLTLPMAIDVIFKIWKNEPSRVYNEYFAKAALLHLSFGVLLCLGLLLK